MTAKILGRVLVVDDEVQLMHALVEALTTQGYEAHGSQTGVAAIEALQIQEFDILLTDLMMPNMDGITLLKACQAIDANLVGILMTGQGTVSTAVEAMKAGAFDYVLKPFRLDMLLPVLKRAREIQQLRLENIQLRETVAIHSLSQTIAVSLDSKIVLEKTADTALQQTDADEVSIMLLMPEQKELSIVAVRGQDRKHLLGQHRSLDEGITGWVARHCEPLILNGEVSDPRFAPIQPRPEIRSAISMPMMTAGKLIGILNVNLLHVRRPFTAGQVKALSILTNTAAAALQNESLFQALRESEARYRLATLATNDVIWEWNSKTKKLTWTENAQLVFGYSPEEISSDQWWDNHIHPEDRQRVIAQMDSALAGTENIWTSEYRFLLKDDSYAHISDHGYIERDASGNPIRMVGAMANVTERKQAEEALKNSEKRFRALIENAPDGIALLGMNGRLQQVTPTVQTILGYTLEESVNQDPALLTHPDDLANLLILLNDLLQHPGKVVRTVYRFRHKDGSWRWLESTISNLILEPSVNAIVFNYRDITEGRLAEEALRESETRFRSLIENSSDEVSILSAEGVLLYESPSSNPTLGYQPGEFLGKNLFMMVHPDDLQRVQYRLEEILRDPTLHPREEFRLLHRNGTWRWVEAVGTNLLDEPSVRGLVINYHDVTERVLGEEALRESEIRFRNLFENTPVSIWEEDFSAVKSYLDDLKGKGILNLDAYLTEHPERVMACLDLVKLLDVNQASLKLHEATVKSALLTNLQKTFAPESFETFKRELMAIANGEQQLEMDVVVQTLTGQRRDATMNWAVVPGNEATYARVLVSLVDITERKRAQQGIQRQLQRLNVLRAIDLAISSTFDMNMSLTVLLHGTVLQLHVSAAAILLFNQTMLTLEYAAGHGFYSPAIQQTRMRLGQGLAGRAALEQNPVHVVNLAQIGSDFMRAQLLKEEAFVSYYGVPLIAKGQLKGVLEIFHRAELHPDQEWLNFLDTLAGQAAIAIDNGQLFEDLRRSNLELELAYDATIEGWSRAMDLRDKETEGHTQRVTDLTLELARAISISESELIQIRRGALLHDMGKLGVPDSILLKPEKLTAEEWEIMKKHPQFAYEMLSSITYLKSALNIPYCHHEKWDGTGYPRGLKGEQIPMAARLFTVVDVWDALTSDRPYRKAWSQAEAVQYITDQSEQHFDPTVVKIFLEMIVEI